MSKIKLKLFVKELPSGKIIPLSSKSYVITKYDQSATEFFKERLSAVNGSARIKNFDSKDVKLSLEDFNKSKQVFNVPNKIVLNDKNAINLESIRKNYNARSSTTDKNGITEVMDLPVGKYAIWITDNRVQNKISRVGNDKGILLHGFEIFKSTNDAISLDIQVKQYYCYRLIDSVTKKPLSDIKFNLYTLGEKNKFKKINRTHIKNLKTNKNGMTPVLYSIKGEVILVGFEKGGIEKRVPINSLKFYSIFSNKNYQDIEWPAVKAISEKPVDTKTNLQQASKIPILFNLLKCEACVLDPENFAKFEEESKQLDKVLYHSYLSKQELDKAISEQASAEVIKALEKKIDENEKKVAEHLNQNFKNKADLAEIFIATSYKTDNGKDVKNGFIRRYIKLKSYEDKYNAKRLNIADFKIDNLTKGLIQSAKSKEISPELKKAGFDELKKIELTLLKQEWYKKEKSIDLISLGGAFHQEAKHSNSFDSSTDAQWLRAIGGAGASGSMNWNPAKGDVGVKVQVTAQAKLVLVEAGYKSNLCVPSRSGVSLKYHDIYLGALRGIVFGEVSAFYGARAAIGFGLNLGYNALGEPELSGDGVIYPKQSVAQNYDSKNKRPTFVVEKEDSKSGSQQGLNADTKIGVEAFSGIEGGLKIGAGLEWLSPESKKFENIASVAPKMAAQAGVSGAYNFEIKLVRGEFRIKVKASLCLGFGAKGELELAVGANKLVEFNRCLAYQLRQNGTKILPYIAKDAFEYWGMLQVYAVIKGISIAYASVREIRSVIKSIYNEFSEAKELKSLAQNININPEALLYATPETRGILLYTLTKDVWFSKSIDRLEYDFSKMEIHHLPERKHAVLNVFKSIMTKSAWDNTLQHMTESGTKAMEPISRLESRIIFFLNEGKFLANQNEVNDAISEGRSCISPPKTGNSILDEYIQLRCNVLDTVPIGQVMLMNDSSDYEILVNNLDLGKSDSDILLASNIEIIDNSLESNNQNGTYQV